MANEPVKAEKKKDRPSIFSRISKFFRDQKSEIKKIIWPTKKQILNNTGIVIGVVAAAAVVAGSFDFLLSVVVTLLFGS